MLESLKLYRVGYDWVWSPDGVGCYWYDTENEAREDSLEPLTMGATFETYEEFEEFRNE